MPWSRSNGLRIYYETAGEGPPLVLLHANPFDHSMWLYQIAHFARGYTVVAPDLRGYGRSDKPEAPFAFTDMANDVLGVVRDRGWSRVALCGVSIGATLALQMALDHPALVTAQILVGGESANPPIFAQLAEDYTSRPIAVQRAEHIRMIVGDDFAATPRGRYLLDTFSESTPSLSGKAIGQIFRARAPVNLRARLPEISLPTLVVNGATDVSLESGRETARRIRGAEHRVIPGAGHMCNFEEPWEFDRLALDFLAAHGYVGG